MVQEVWQSMKMGMKGMVQEMWQSMKMGMKGMVQEVLQVWCRKCGRHGAGSVAVSENGYERCGAGSVAGMVQEVWQ